jgi:hypothetical protein
MLLARADGTLKNARFFPGVVATQQRNFVIIISMIVE